MADTWRELDKRGFWKTAEETKSGSGGRKEGEEGPEFKQPCAGSKMAAGKAGDRWSFPGTETEKWGKGKGKNKYHRSQKFKNKPKNLKDKQLASEVPPACRAF